MLPPTDFHPSHLVSIISPLSPPLTNLARNHPHLLEQFSTLLTRTTTLAAAYTTLSRTLMRTIAGPILHICYNAQMRYYASMRSLCCVRHRTAVLPRIKKLQKLARGLWRLLYPAPRFSETVLGEKLGVYAPQLEGMVDAGLSFNEMGALVLTVVPVGLMAGVLARGMVDRSVVAALLGVGWQVHAVYERAKVRVEVKRWVKGQRVEVPVMVPEDLAEDERNTDATTTPPQTEPNAVKKRRNRHKKNTLKPEEKDQVDDENKPPATGGNKNRRRMKNRAKA